TLFIPSVRSYFRSKYSQQFIAYELCNDKFMPTMSLTFIIVFFITEYVVADECLASARNESARNYVSCLKKSIAKDRDTYEAEIHSHIRDVAKKCFMRNISKTSCDLAENEFSTVSWDAKPKDCPQCAMAKSDGKAEGNFIRPEDVICLRVRVAEELVDEVERCMKKKHIDILPAFRSLIDTASEFANLTTQISNAILDYMTIYTRLATCALSNETVAKKTSDCVDGSLHNPTSLNCEIEKTCQSNIPSECKDSFADVRNSFCSCLTEIQTSTRQRFSRIGSAVEEAFAKNMTKNITAATDICISAVKAQVRNNANNWIDDIGSAFLACTPKARNGPPSTETLLKAACVSAAMTNEPKDAKQLTAALSFISAYLDAVGDRLRVICTQSCT
uniref:Uncharacterized protein n=1 Tax=Parascaris univalens TaxID=6257 RepID=A0A915CDZ1_PARUN